MKLYVVPQLPVKNRYQSWIVGEIEAALSRYNVDYEILDLGREPVSELTNYFTNEPEAIKYELEQIRELLARVRSGDRVLWMDIDYPGFSVSAMYHLRRAGAINYGIVHGAYFNDGDIWSGIPERKYHMLSAILISERIFVGSRYFWNELVRNLGEEVRNKIIITGLPFRRRFYGQYVRDSDGKTVSYIGTIPSEHEEVLSNMGYRLVRLFGLEYEKYLDELSRSVALITYKRAETFGYTILEALALGVPVIAPRKFSYVEFGKMLRNKLAIIYMGGDLDMPSLIERAKTLGRRDVLSDAESLLDYMERSSDRIVRAIVGDVDR